MGTRRSDLRGLVAFLALWLAPVAGAQAGQLDPSFGGDGIVTTQVGPRGDFATAIALQTDGRIVVGGVAAWDTPNPKFDLARYNSDGTLDTTFGGDGIVTTDFTTHEDGVYSIGIQPDGKIVAAGDAGLGSGDSRFAVARYNPDGTLDTTFGGDGKVTTQFGPRDDPVAGLALQADGKIVVSGGTAFNGANPRFALARYADDGTLDSTFSGDGKVTTDLSGGRDYANAVVVQTDGRIVAGGLAFPGGTRASFALARYDGDGTLDTTFSGDGKLTTNFTSWHDSVQNVALQPGGEIVAAGIAGAGGSNGRFALARYESDGTLDLSFSGDGKQTTDFTPNFDGAWDVAVQADGKIVAAGDAAGGGGRFALARYEADGTLDGTLSGDGKATANITPRADFVYGVVLQSDGKIVLAGGSGWGGANPAFALARFHSA